MTYFQYIAPFNENFKYIFECQSLVTASKRFNILLKVENK